MRLGLEAGKDTLDLAVELGIRGVPISADRLVQDGVQATLAPLRIRRAVSFAEERRYAASTRGSYQTGQCAAMRIHISQSSA